MYLNPKSVLFPPMGQKPTGPAQGFALRVIEVLEAARNEEGMTKAALIRTSGIAPNTYHVRMRGDMPFDLNEIDRLAKALNRDPMLLLREAGSGILDGPPAPITPLRPGTDVGADLEDLPRVARKPEEEKTDEQ